MTQDIIVYLIIALAFVKALYAGTKFFLIPKPEKKFICTGCEKHKNFI